MARTTAIQWCDSTENPTMGCDGCELWNDNNKTCYAGALHRRFGGVSTGYAPTFDAVTKFAGRMELAARWSDLRGTKRSDKPWLNGLPRLIFVSDMSDALSQVIDFDYLREEVIDVARSPNGQRHCWLWLTKRPQRLAALSDSLGHQWPPNLWVGTSITTRKSTGRIPHLLKVGDEHTTRFLSVEPQWESLSLSEWLPQLDWVIQGGESGPAAHDFHVEWAESVAEECRTAGVPYFLKQLGANVVRRGVPFALMQSHGGDWSEWPRALRVRQLPSLG